MHETRLFLHSAPFQDDITDEELLLELEGFEDHKAGIILYCVENNG